MKQHAVVIAGGGPTGLMLAAELALARVDVAIVERRESQALAGSRAGGLHSRTIEVLDQRGVAERFLAQGRVLQVGGIALIPLDISDFPTRHNYGLALGQERIERTLAAWVDELAVPIYRAREVTGFAQDDTGVDVALSDGRSLRAKYLVGCDGGRSLIRKRAGIDFPGWDASITYLIAEGEMTEEPAWGLRRDERGINALGKWEDGRVRVVLNEPHVRPGDEPTLDDLREALRAVYGTDFGVHDVTYLSRFTDAARQAASYRERRVLLAGDAAHVHSPAGGQGLNIGIHDAVNLGWKLAQVVNGTSPESLLDTYQAERHPIGARVLKLTMAATALNRGDERTKALYETLSELLEMDEPRKRYAAMIAGLDVHYDLGAGHPLLGRRMPDLDLVTESGPRRVFTLLHAARPVLLNLGEPGALDIAPWADRVQRVDARCGTGSPLGAGGEARSAGAWELPVLGAVAAPSAVLIRPDGHVAWVGDGADHGLRDALATWFGPAHRSEPAPSAVERRERAEGRARSLIVADTAFSIAVVRAEERQRPQAERLFDDPYAAVFAAAGAHAIESTQRFLDLPFFRDGVRLRTRFIDDALRDGLAAGLDQVVLLGAGFDARGLRMPELKRRGVSVYEVDGPDQLRRKRAVLADAGVTIPEALSYVAFDFEAHDIGDELASALEAKGFRRGAGALFVWEGVIGYIGDEAIDRSLRFMASAGGPRSRVVFTFGEGTFHPETAAERTRRAGWSSCEELAGDELWRRYLSGPPHPSAFVMKLGVAVV